MKGRMRIGEFGMKMCRNRAGVLMCIAVASAFVVGARAETILFKSAHVHTVTGPTLSPGQVLVRDGRIEEVGANIGSKADRVLDLGAQHLYPGLIAPDVQLGLIEIDGVRSTVDTTEVGEFTPDVQAWIAINPDSELIPVTRANGITHAEVAPQGGMVAGQSGVFALTGWTWEDMTIKRPVGLHVYWPDMSLDTTPKELAKDKAKLKSLDDQAKERDRKLKALDDFFEEARAYSKARPKVPVLAWEAMLPFVRGEAPLFIHADELRQIKSAVAWATTRGYRMVLVEARDAWRAADLLAEKKIPVIYEAVFALPARQIDPYDVHFKAPSVLHRAGVMVAISPESRASNLRNQPYAAAQAMAFGLPEEEALKSITFNSAKILGLEDRLGSIAKGREASLFAADGNILDIRSRVTRMWIAGKEVSLESRHTRLYDKYRNRPKQP